MTPKSETKALIDALKKNVSSGRAQSVGNVYLCVYLNGASSAETLEQNQLIELA